MNALWYNDLPKAKRQVLKAKVSQKSHCVLGFISEMEVLQPLEVKVLSRATFHYTFPQINGLRQGRTIEILKNIAVVVDNLRQVSTAQEELRFVCHFMC